MQFFEVAPLPAAMMPARERIEVQSRTIQFSALKKGFQYGAEHLLVPLSQDRHFEKT